MFKAVRKLYGTYTGLLLVLLFIFFLPVLRSIWSERLFFDIILSLIIIASIGSVYKQTKIHGYIWVLGLAALFSQWAEHLMLNSTVLLLISNILTAVFLGFTSVVIVIHIVTTQSVTQDMLAGAVSAYLLIGMTFSVLYTCVEAVQPNSFNVPQIDYLTREVPSFFYYSFVTLTTLGFGDIAPRTEVARALSIIEAILGQMYLAILIASMVGKVTAASRIKEHK